MVGNLLGVAVMLGVDHAASARMSPLARAGVFLAGGLWSALLTLVIWRTHPHRRRARAVGQPPIAA